MHKTILSVLHSTLYFILYCVSNTSSTIVLRKIIIYTQQSKQGQVLPRRNKVRDKDCFGCHKHIPENIIGAAIPSFPRFEGPTNSVHNTKAETTCDRTIAIKAMGTEIE